MHNRKLIKIRQERENLKYFDKKIFFQDYENDFIERISLINEDFNKCLAYGFRGEKPKFSSNVKNILYGNLGKNDKTEINYD